MPKPLESDIQAYCVIKLRERGYVLHGDQSGQWQQSVMQRVKAARTGLCKGWPDCMVLLDQGRTLYIEFKRSSNKKPSSAQSELHTYMRSMGHLIYVVVADTGEDALEQVLSVLAGIPHALPSREPLDLGF